MSINTFHVIAQMVEDNSKGVRASLTITDAKDGKQGGKITMATDSSDAQRIMNGLLRGNDDMLVMLVMVDKAELNKTRKQLEDSRGKE
jgi:hypothetical protein